MRSELAKASPLKMRRVQKGYSQDALAKGASKFANINLSQWRISLLERGMKPTLEEAEALSKVLQAGIGYLWEPPLSQIIIQELQERGRMEREVQTLEGDDDAH